MRQEITHPYAPVYDERSTVLVLGTMPSPKSREVGFYYGHPQNRFWAVLAALFCTEVPQTTEERKNLCLVHGIALWDVLAACEIDGAADSSIKNPVANDLTIITQNAPIKAVFTTGQKAYALYEKHCYSQTRLAAVALPSTSPANAAFSLDKLVLAYRAILPHLPGEK